MEPNKLTPQQRKVRELYLGGNRKIGEIMREAGYSEEYVRTANYKHKEWFENMEDESLKLFEEKLKLTLDALTPEKIQAESGHKLAEMADRFKKNVLLAQGKSTQNLGFVITEGDGETENQPMEPTPETTGDNTESIEV